MKKTILRQWGNVHIVEGWCEVKVKVMSVSLWPHRLYSPWNSPGQDTGVGSLSLLQGIFPTQGSNPGLQHCRWILYQLSHKGSSRILEWVAYPFSRGSSRPRNWTGVSCIAGRFFTSWTTREAPPDVQPFLFLDSLSLYLLHWFPLWIQASKNLISLPGV